MPLDFNSPSNYTGRMAAADVYDPNEFAESRENYRNNRARAASFEALMRRLEPPDMQRQRARVADIEDTQDDMFDLQYREPARTAIRGRLKRREGDLDAVAEQNRYFEHEPMRRDKAGFARQQGDLDAIAEQSRYFTQEPMRRDKEAASLRALRERYTDPALIKAEADIRREAARQYGGIARDQVLTGDREAGATGRAEMGGRMGPPRGELSMSGPRGVAAYAAAQGISIDEAVDQARQLGYVIVD